jgi:hypothetical protein
MLMALYNATAKLKADAVCGYVADLLESCDEKFLVFAHHKVRGG